MTNKDNDSYPVQYQLFARLLDLTAGQAHGTYPELQEDNDGSVWQYVPNGEVEREEAMIIVKMTMGSSAPTGAFDHRLPERNRYLLVRGDDTDLIALYHTSNDKFYLMRADGRRYYTEFLRGRQTMRTSPASTRVVGETLKQLYGVKL